MNTTFSQTVTEPLAARMRPRRLQDVIGQTHLLGPGRPLQRVVETKKCHSMILWGPPGVGKTTLAQLLAQALGAEFRVISAVLSGVKEIRESVAYATELRQQGKTLVLFVDEVHRFNKAQQDAFLPHVEAGLFYLIGATTENPSFSLNNALLSRVRVYLLKSFTQEELITLLERALQDPVHGLGGCLHLQPTQLAQLAACADGDARQALNLLELAADLADTGTLSDTELQGLLRTALRRFDRQGDWFYDVVSALHKSMRGSDPDAALYWFARLMDGGCDPAYVARRVVRMASEDIGNADPRALSLALDAWQAYERLGSPEGELALAQAIVYCAIAAKSNAMEVALHAAHQAVAEHGSLEVPIALRNAPTKLMRELGHGQGYRYAHDEPDGVALGFTYLPEPLLGAQFYAPVERGLEIKIKERLAQLRALNRQQKG